MFCPHCGKKIQLQDQKFCDNCGFDLSKIGKGQPSELKKMIDFALKEQTKSVPTEKQEGVSPAVTLPSVQPVKTTWWKALNRAQITILIIGCSFSLLMLLMLAVSPSGINITAILFGVAIIVLTTLLIAYKAPVWGWGWYILLGIIVNRYQNRYAEYGDLKSLLQLFPIIVSLTIYFLFRKKVLKRVRVLWQRSLYSGIIALFSAAFATSFAALLLPTQADRLARQFYEEARVLITNTQDFIEKDKRLWAQFIPQPATESDYKNNIVIVEAAMPLYQKKDSVLVHVFRRMHAALEDTYTKTQSAKWPFSFTPDDYVELVNKTEEISRLDQLMLVNLWSYYKSLLSSDENYQEYWKAYEEAQAHLNVVVQDYSALYKKFWGEDLDLSKGLDEFKNKYSR